MIKINVMNSIGKINKLGVVRKYSTGKDSYKFLVDNARENVNVLLEKQDRSSYVLAQYIPEPARDAFLAIRAFNVEINRITDGGKNKASTSFQASKHLSSNLGFSTTDVKFKFWSDRVSEVFSKPSSDKNIGEPILILLRDSLRRDLNLELNCFHRILQTRRHFMENKSFKNGMELCSYGEGTYSQLNYLTQGLLLSPSISPSSIALLELSPKLQSTCSDIAAHIGQATALSTFILSLSYYATQLNQVVLPIDIMTKHDLSQEDVLRYFQGHLSNASERKQFTDKMKDVLFDSAIIANDHMLTARSKLNTLRIDIKSVLEADRANSELRSASKRWRNGIPDALFIPFMSAIPTSLYLNKLQKYDFDITNAKLNQREWRLGFTSFKNYYQRKI